MGDNGCDLVPGLRQAHSYREGDICARTSAASDAVMTADDRIANDRCMGGNATETLQHETHDRYQRQITAISLKSHFIGLSLAFSPSRFWEIAAFQLEIVLNDWAELDWLRIDDFSSTISFIWAWAWVWPAWTFLIGNNPFQGHPLFQRETPSNCSKSTHTQSVGSGYWFSTQRHQFTAYKYRIDQATTRQISLAFDKNRYKNGNLVEIKWKMFSKWKISSRQRESPFKQQNR